MALTKEIIENTIQPHGGTLINREVNAELKETMLEVSHSMPAITLNPWSLSDLELIGIGGFSPLTGFMNEADYNEVVENLHLKNGLVWSIPITLPVTEDKANELEIGESIALYGEDNHLYGVLELEEKYTYDKEKEAAFVYGTTDIEHPGVLKVYEKGCLLYTSPSPRDRQKSRMPSSA